MANMDERCKNVVKFYNGRGTAEHEGKQILVDSGITMTQVDTLQEAATAIKG